VLATEAGKRIVPRLLQFWTKPIAHIRFPCETEGAATLDRAWTASSLLMRKPVRQRATAGAMDGM
jgi:hypothetical protein